MASPKYDGPYAQFNGTLLGSIIPEALTQRRVSKVRESLSVIEGPDLGRARLLYRIQDSNGERESVFDSESCPLSS
jgi:hypothetical protein